LGNPGRTARNPRAHGPRVSRFLGLNPKSFWQTAWVANSFAPFPSPQKSRTEHHGRKDRSPPAEESKVIAARNKNLDLAIQQIAKDFGEGAIMRLGSTQSMDIETIPTGNILIDRALGVGGLPRGRIVEVFGPESSGKTTFTLTIVAQAQKRGGLAAFIDVEHALDPTYARKLGVNVDELLVSQPSSGEEALRICETLVRSNALDVIVIDSVAALVTKAELEGEIGRYDRGRAGPADERGAAEADVADREGAHRLHFHQPDPRKNRRDVRQPGDHAWWQGA